LGDECLLADFLVASPGLEWIDDKLRVVPFDVPEQPLHVAEVRPGGQVRRTEGHDRAVLVLDEFRARFLELVVAPPELLLIEGKLELGDLKPWVELDRAAQKANLALQTR